MKKRSLSRYLSLLLAVAVALGLVCFNTGDAMAQSDWTIGSPDVLWKGADSQWVNVWKGNQNATVTKVSSGNTKVIAIEKFKGENEKGKTQTFYYIAPKSTGKATITVNFTTPGGKKLKAKKTIRVKKYPNEITSLKVNGKKVNISKNKFRYDKGKITASKVKVALKLKKGWKIANVYGNCWNNSGSFKEIKNAKSLVKKGSEIKFPKKYSEFELLIEMTNGKDMIDYHIRLSRNKNP